MEKATLEVVVERLDRLEKMIGHINEQLSWIVEEVVPDVPKARETAAALRAAEVLLKILERMGYPPDFDGHILPRKFWTEYLKKWAFHLIFENQNS